MSDQEQKTKGTKEGVTYLRHSEKLKQEGCKDGWFFTAKDNDQSYHGPHDTEDLAAQAREEYGEDNLLAGWPYLSKLQGDEASQRIAFLYRLAEEVVTGPSRLNIGILSDEYLRGVQAGWVIQRSVGGGDLQMQAIPLILHLPIPVVPLNVLRRLRNFAEVTSAIVVDVVREGLMPECLPLANADLYAKLSTLTGVRLDGSSPCEKFHPDFEPLLDMVTYLIMYQIRGTGRTERLAALKAVNSKDH